MEEEDNFCAIGSLSLNEAESKVDESEEFSPVLSVLDNGTLFSKICSYLDSESLEKMRLVNSFFHSESTPWFKRRTFITLGLKLSLRVNPLIPISERSFKDLMRVQRTLRHNNFVIIIPNIPDVVMKRTRRFIGSLLYFFKIFGEEVQELTLHGPTEVIDLHQLFNYVPNIQQFIILSENDGGPRLDAVAPEQIPEIVLPLVKDVILDLEFWELCPTPQYQHEKGRLFVEKLLDQFPSMRSLELKDTSQNCKVLNDVFKYLNKDLERTKQIKKLKLELPFWENWERFKFMEFFPGSKWAHLESLELLNIDECVEQASFYKALDSLANQLKHLSLSFNQGFEENEDCATQTCVRFSAFPALISLSIVDESSNSTNYIFKHGGNRVHYDKDFPRLRKLELQQLQFDEIECNDMTETLLFKAFLPTPTETENGDLLVIHSKTVQKLLIGFENDVGIGQRIYCSRQLFESWKGNILNAFSHLKSHDIDWVMMCPNFD